MKHPLTLAAALAACAAARAVPCADTFPAVTNAWAAGAFSNVFERAALRLSADSHDVVAAYLLFDWSLAFGDRADISNAVTRVVAASDRVDDASFTAVYSRLRPLCLAYRDEFLPRVTDDERQAEQRLLRADGARLADEFVLQLLWDRNLW